MTSPATVYANCSKAAAFRLPSSIFNHTTPEEFDRLRSGSRLKDLSLGEGVDAMNCLCRAAETGNVKLIRHIVKLGGNELLDLGDRNGLTPLNTAVLHRKYAAAEELIRLGANVNLATSSGGLRFVGRQLPELNYHPSVDFHKGATPLWSAIRTNEIAFITLILKSGGVRETIKVPFRIFTEENQQYEQAQMGLEDLKSQIDSGLDSFPEAVANLVYEYV